MFNSSKRFERRVKRKRKHRYRQIKKLFRARSMAAKYLPVRLRISQIDKYIRYKYGSIDNLFVDTIAEILIEEYNRVIPSRRRPSPPVSHN